MCWVGGLGCIQAETWWKGVTLLQVTVQQVLSCSEASCGLSCGAVSCEDFSSSSCSVLDSCSLFFIIPHHKTSRGWNSAVKESSVIPFKPACLWPKEVLCNLILAKHPVLQRTAQEKPCSHNICCHDWFWRRGLSVCLHVRSVSWHRNSLSVGGGKRIGSRLKASVRTSLSFCLCLSEWTGETDCCLSAKHSHLSYRRLALFPAHTSYQICHKIIHMVFVFEVWPKWLRMLFVNRRWTVASKAAGNMHFFNFHLVNDFCCICRFFKVELNETHFQLSALQTAGHRF